MRFSQPFCARLADGAKSFLMSVPPEPTYPCKILSQWVPVCQSYSQNNRFRTTVKVTVLGYMLSAYMYNMNSE